MKRRLRGLPAQLHVELAGPRAAPAGLSPVRSPPFLSAPQPPLSSWAPSHPPQLPVPAEHPEGRCVDRPAPAMRGPGRREGLGKTETDPLQGAQGTAPSEGSVVGAGLLPHRPV